MRCLTFAAALIGNLLTAGRRTGFAPPRSTLGATTLTARLAMEQPHRLRSFTPSQSAMSRTSPHSRGADGQLGNGGTSNSSTPVLVPGVGGIGTLANITAVAGGGLHSLALSSSGAVYAWGQIEDCQLGTFSMTTAGAPVLVQGVGNIGTLANITAIAAGKSGSCALSSTGTVYAWGNVFGNNNGSSTPVLVARRRRQRHPRQHHGHRGRFTSHPCPEQQWIRLCLGIQLLRTTGQWQYQ